MHHYLFTNSDMDPTTMAELNRPLLTSRGLDDNTNMSSPIELPSWPTEAAGRLKMLVPEDYSSLTAAVFCHLILDVEQGLIRVVAAPTASNDNDGSQEEQGQVVLDVIDVEDMIGAQLKIDFKASASRSATAATVPGRASNEPANDTVVDRQGQAVLTIYSYPRRNPANDSWFKKWCGSLFSFSSTRTPPPNPPSYQRPTDSSILQERISHPRSFILAPAEDLTDANLVLQGLRRLATGIVTERTALVLCSPVSGPRKDAPLVYEKHVRPVLEQAHITSELLITTHAGHGRERMAAISDASNISNGEKDVTAYDAVIIMAGDGLIYEVVNGIMDRSDAESVLAKVKVGVVGCGTSNGLVASLAKHASEKDNLMTSLFMIAKSRTIKIDLSKHQTESSTQYSFLTYSYGMIADIDIKSEIIRWVGSFRFDLYGALNVLKMPRYRARFTYLPADKVPNHKHQALGVMPATVQEGIPESNQDWVRMGDQDIIIFWPSHVSHAASRTHHCPDSRLQAGFFKVFLVRGKVSRLRMALILIGLETGTHAQYEQCEFIDCCAYRLEPITPGLSVLDGELIEEGPIQAKVLPAALTVFCHVPTN